MGRQSADQEQEQQMTIPPKRRVVKRSTLHSIPEDGNTRTVCLLRERETKLVTSYGD
jgi:hypothetical protein